MGKKIKSPRFIVAFFAISVVLVSCDNHDDVAIVKDLTPIEEVTVSVISENEQKKVNHLMTIYGGEESDYVIEDEDIIFQHCMRFIKNEIIIPDSSAVETRAHYWLGPNYMVYDSYTTILVEWGSDVPTVWQSAIVSAIIAINNLNGKIKYTVDKTSNWKAKTEVVYVPLTNQNNIADALSPLYGNGKPGNRIRINSNRSLSEYSADKKKWIMVHEFFHTLGFLHTENQNNTHGPPYYMQMPNCQGIDQYSVMRSGPAFVKGFTDCDISAYNMIYGY